MELKDIFSKLKSGEVKAHSELGTRDESKQTKNFGSRIQKMKTVTGINARAMVMKDLVIPFNPFTGEADDTYNRKTPFRPILLVSQAIEGIKDACANDANLKAFWEKTLGISFSSGAATMEEYTAFKNQGYIKPRVMSYATVAMSFNGMHGFPEFRVKYTVDTNELNENGTYDYETAPIWHKGAIFFNAMAKLEADEVQHKMEAAGQSKDAISSHRRAIFAKSPVGFVAPTNLIPFLFFPLNEVPRTFDVTHPQELEQAMRFYSFTDKWTIPLREAIENPLYDTDIDFYDFAIKTPSSNTTKSNGQVYTDDDSMELYTAMSISSTDGRQGLHGGVTIVDNQPRKNEEVFANVFAAARAYFLYSQEQSSVEGGETFEKIMAVSNRFRPITSVINNFLPACNDVFNTTFAGSKYCTDAIKAANSEFFTAMNPDNALALAAADEEELEEAKAAQKETVEAIIAETNPIQPSAIDDDLGVDLSALELE